MVWVFPVVHVWTPVQAVAQSMLALEVGADGVYLIHHDGSAEDLLAAYTAVREATGDVPFVGLNILDAGSGFEAFVLLLDAHKSGLIPDLPDGLWVDDARPRREDASDLRDENDELGSIRYLGGTSFKYTSSYSDDPRIAASEAARAAPHVDVVCTSGPGTGVAPNPEKIAAMKSTIGRQPLAIASGVDRSNLHQYSSWVDEVLVATSVETEPYSGVFDEPELRRLVDLAHRPAQTRRNPRAGPATGC